MRIRKMSKKLFGIMMVCSMLVLMLAGCGGGSAAVTVDTSKLADDIYAGVTWQDQIGEVDLSKALALYGIDSGAVASGKVYISTNATAEEIAVLEASSADQTAAIKSGLEARVEAQKASFESYNAAEVPKLENAYIKTNGNYVILVVCDTVAEAEAVVNNAFSGK